MSYIYDLIKDAKIKDLFSEKTYKEGEIIFDEGEESDSLYIIDKGDVIIEKAINKEKTEFKDIAIISEGNFLGEIAMFEKTRRTARARAIADIKVYEIKRENFFEIIKRDEEIAVKIFSTIIKTLSLRLAHTSKELTLLYDISKHLSEEYNDEKEFLSSLIDEISMYFPEWGIEGYFYNQFNLEFEKIKELNKNYNFDLKISDYKDSLWLDDNKYLMQVKVKQSLMASILFASPKRLTRNEINDFTTIFNTIYFIASNGIEKTSRNKEDFLLKKLKQKKTGI
ncbi:MAG TPA: cyclic nucleotide-binding domain-containing protein [Elusimicrobiales bacterium]|nr:cyclic nucleotide-binding domain-containing protein [Elusimicrobiales bacterium]HOL63016.1 cyclic nucleotide-binding domain-containing protein [Elusimicrobiales bacterium]HPO94783.1 cyclic nucleotide-binding domain-containing protein [Elusimicrobiales bacterium]